MRIYTVHLPAAAGDTGEDRAAAAVLVKEGFCWPAFFFAPLWALWHRLWLFFALVLAGGWAVTAAAARSTGTRTPVFWLRTRYPGPLDDGGRDLPKAGGPQF